MKLRIIYFFIIGLTLYLIDLGFNSNKNNEIYISDQEILSLISAWKSQVGREPNNEEIVRIINNLVDEEILYREALLLGLDKEDKIIKRRLAQKISFLKQETINKDYSKDEIIKYFNQNKKKYFVDPIYSFTHYFFSNDNDSFNRSKIAFKKIQNGDEIISDPFFLGKNFTNQNLAEINRNFGNEFTKKITNHNLNEWSKPIKSSYGYHIVLISDYVSGYFPDINEVLFQVETDFLQSNKDKRLKSYLDEKRKEYKIYINPDLKF